MKRIILILVTMVSVLSCTNEQNELPITFTQIEYNSQDNILLLDNVWKQNLNDSMTPINWVGIDGTSSDYCIKVMSYKKIKSIALIGFDYPYYVSYVNGNIAIIYCQRLNEHRNNTDLYKFLITHEIQ